MNLIRAFFELNSDIIQFVYGLVFFVLGLGIALQSRRYSRLDLASSLSWLAGFGFTHAFHEWGDLFIPIQAAYLPPQVVEILYGAHLLLLAISFVCLLEFGISLLQPLGWARWLHTVPGGLLAAWLFVSFVPLPAYLPDPSAWHDISNALARYFIGFPGGLLAAYGLRQQAFRRIAPLNVPQIVSMLRVAGVTLLLYAVFGGLIPPAIPFLPGSVLNSTSFQQALGVPPLVFRSLIGLALAITIIRALEVFEVETERMIETMEQQQILAAERDRIGRELHDGAIQTVYTAGLLIESARQLAQPGGALESRLAKAESVLNEAIRDLRRSLSGLRLPAAAEPLPEALHRLAADPRFTSMVEVSLAVDLPGDEALSPVRAGHVLAIASEALSNVVRHAQARQVKIAARRADGRLRLSIQDDGVGLTRENEAGFGLRNMRDRARLLGGRLEVSGAAGKGTSVLLDVPWTEAG